jgi:predicted kinase
MLIVLAGLPGAGKTTIARELAPRLRAVHVRIDTIEHAIRQSAAHADPPMDDAGYLVGYAIAEDNLRLGHVVIADSVNPWPLTREAWRAVGERSGVAVLEVEIVCSDAEKHRRRVESRAADIDGFRLPTWREVLDRDYRAWDRDRLVIDTAATAPMEVADAVVAAVRALTPDAGRPPGFRSPMA